MGDRVSMGKIKKIWKEKSIKKDFAAYLLCYVLGALILSVSCSALLLHIQRTKIPKEYVLEYVEEGEIKQFSQENLREMYESGEQSEEWEPYTQKLRVQEFVDEYGNTVYLNSLDPVLTIAFEPFDEFLYNFLGTAGMLVYPVVFVIGIAVTSRLFYKRNLQEPLEILSHAADNISNSDLDFEISYERQDELGKLCASFEKMRRTLQENNREMWRQIEERKRLNAAFSHDLRTPLTVLKGQSEMLVKYAPEMQEEKIAKTAEMMGRHIARLENYVNTMGDLQRLEDIEVKKQRVEWNELVKQLRETGESIVGEHDLPVNLKISDTREKQRGEYLADGEDFEEKEGGADLRNVPSRERMTGGIPTAVKLEVDLSAVMQVYENLLANAVRYAKKEITVSLSGNTDHVSLTVSDDGEGFSPKDLKEAAKPFYRAGNEAGSEHFGMGLNICKVLCEKHGGYLKLKNDGGASVTAMFGR